MDSFSALGFIIPFVLGGVTFSLVLAVLYLTSEHSKQRHVSLCDAVAAADINERTKLLQLFSAGSGGLPAWLRFLDTDHPAWLNSGLQVLWPHIDRAASTWAFKDRALETLLNSQSFWKPGWLAASGVVLQSLVLGQVPPQVTAIKVYGHGGEGGGGPAEALIADISFDWASKMQVQMQMKTLADTTPGVIDRMLSVVFRAVRLKVIVRDLVARGNMRVVVSPLLREIPVAGAVRVSFLGAPTVSYLVTSLGTNPLMIPGLEAWLNSFISNQVLQPFTFPEGFTVNIAELFGLDVAPSPVRPEGILSVTVHSASNVPRMDLFGLSDPYVKIWLQTKMKRRTSVKGWTLNPVWNEAFEFLVHDIHSQVVTLEVWDSDVLNPDDLIGRVEIPLDSLDLTLGRSNDLSLVIPRQGEKRKQRGQKARKRRKPSPSVPERGSTAEDAVNAQQQQSEIQQQADNGHGSEEEALTAFEKFHQQASSKLHFSKECRLEVTITHFPFSSHESKAAQDVQRGLRPQLTMVSPRLRPLLNGGMLYISLTRAEGLLAHHSLTKKFRLKTSVGPRDGAPVYKKTVERTGIGSSLDARAPVFDQSIDFLVDGETASAGDTVFRVEIWVAHVITRPSYRGAVTIPLHRVIAAGRIHDTWPLEDGQGRMDMRLEWQGMMEMRNF